MYSSHEKTKTTFTLLRTVCKGGLHNYCCFYSCWCFYVFFLYDNFVFNYLCIFLFRHQRMYSWATQDRSRRILGGL